MSSPNIVIQIDRKTMQFFISVVVICFFAHLAWSETLTLATTYPSPSGIYNQLITTGNAGTTPADTTLNRNAGITILAPQTNLNGRVGIGTATPGSAYKLDVLGATNVSGNLSVNGDITGNRVLNPVYAP